MALSATVTVNIEKALKAFLKDPLIWQNTMNRENIYLAAELCNYRRRQKIRIDFTDSSN